MMLAYRLVRLIEAHSPRLIATYLDRIATCDKTTHYKERVPTEDLRQRVFEIYQHLGQWLLSKSEADIQRHYGDTATSRFAQQLPLSDLIWAIFLIKDNLLEFLKSEVVAEQAAEILGEMEIIELLDQFFERAVYYAAVVYERCATEQRQSAAV